jgi:hypothetical protein
MEPGDIEVHLLFDPETINLIRAAQEGEPVTLRVIGIRAPAPPDEEGEEGGGGDPTPTPEAVPTYWWDDAYDRRMVVSAKNNSGIALPDHLLSVTIPEGVSIDSDSLRVVEMTAVGSIDRAYDWRYGTGTFPVNHFWTLPKTLNGSTLTVKALGAWAAGETRHFGVYWDSAGEVAAESVNHLNAIAQRWTHVVTAGSTGDTYRLVIGGQTYSHMQTSGQTASDIAAALRVLVNAGNVAVASGTGATVFITATDPTSLTFTSANTGTTTPANLTVVKPYYWGAGRVGPDNDLFDAASFWMGYPYHNPVSGLFLAPGLGRSDSMLARLMSYSVNGVGVQRLTGGTITGFTRQPEKLRVEGALTFPTRSGGVDWSAAYTAEHRNIVYGGRKSDNTNPNGLMKLVDALHVVLTYTCERAYTPTAVSGGATVTGSTELLGVIAGGNFNANTTEAAGNRIPMYSAPLTTGDLTQLAAASDLSNLPVLDTIIGGHSNLGGMALVVRDVQLSGFGSQQPEVKWSMPASPAPPNAPNAAILHLRNLSTASTIPQGAQIVLSFDLINGLTRNATGVGDNLLPDEMVSIVRSLGITPTITVGSVETYQDDVEATMELATTRAIRGGKWLQDNAEARTGDSWNHVYEYHVQRGVTVVQDGSAPADDHDGAYGNSHFLAGLSLYFLRTHDETVLPILEKAAQWILHAEARAVEMYGSYWAGSVPYWVWTLDTPSGSLPQEGGIQGGGSTGLNVDPNFNGGQYGALTYTKGQPRRNTSVDQVHIMCIGLYHYLYLLRNEPAVTGTQTYADVLAYLGRLATFEAAHWNFPASRMAANLLSIVNGSTPTQAVGIGSSDYPAPYHGAEFGLWQINNQDNFNVNPSANVSMDGFFNWMLAPNTSAAALERFMKGRTKDMLAGDYGHHDVVSIVTANAGAPAPRYPKGWLPRAAGGTKYRYSNGRAGDDHYLEVSTGYRDAYNGRTPNRTQVVALTALMDRTFMIPVEMDSGSVVREINVVDALDDLIHTQALLLPEPTTGAMRYAAAGTLGKTTSFDPQVIDIAFTGYSIFANELWWLVHTDADIADYYPIGGWA